MLCALHHPLQVSSECTDVCVLCRETGKVAMHCVQCRENVCDKCLYLYKDIGFAMFVSKEDRRSLFAYARNSDCAVQRYRDPYCIGVYNLRQEFDDTDEHREILKDRIKWGDESVLELKRKLSPNVTVTDFVNKRCAPHHTLQAGGLDNLRYGDFCILCCNISDSKPAAAMHCLECREPVCVECLPVYKDTRFARFLSKEHRSSLFVYQDDPECATKRGDGKWKKKVYELHQEFHNTAEHFEILKEKITTAEKSVWELRRKLAASEARVSLILK